MPRYMVWDQLPQEARSLSPDKLAQLLEANGIELLPTGPIGGTFAGQEAMAKHQAPSESATDQFKALVTKIADMKTMGRGKEYLQDKAKMLAGGVSMGLGGAGPIMSGVGALANAKFGADPTSGHGIGDLLTNIVSGRAMPAIQAGSWLKNSPIIRDLIAGTGILGAGSAAGEGLSEAMGEHKGSAESASDRAMRIVGNSLAGGAVGATAPALLGAGVRNIQRGYEKAAPVVRQKVQPYVEKLRQMGAPVAVEAEAAAPEDPLLARIQAMTDTVRKKFAEKGLPSPDPQPTATPDELLDQQLKGSLKAKGITPPAETPATPELDPIAKRIADYDYDRTRYKRGLFDKSGQRNVPEGYEEEVVGAIKKRGAPQYADDLLDKLEDLPSRMKALDNVFPEGEFNKVLRERMLNRVFQGIGDENASAFGDLSPLQAIKSFGGKDIGGKKGVDIINQVFDSPDAYKNIEAIHDAVMATQVSQGAKGAGDKIKVFWNAAGPGVSLGLGGFAGYSHNPLLTGLAIAIGAPTGTRMIRIGAEKLGNMIGTKGTKWAEVLRDSAEGIQRRGGPSINQVISYIRRNADSDELQEEQQD